MRVSDSSPSFVTPEAVKGAAFDVFGRTVYTARILGAAVKSHYEAKSNTQAIRELWAHPEIQGSVAEASINEAYFQGFYQERRQEVFDETRAKIDQSTIDHKLGGPRFMGELLARMDD